ncbi:MAG: hypothetical protein JWN24_1612 [Phycisphaerales bacterium]|nr:hypothetical protein [Phycisphaerales bacterium]
MHIRAISVVWATVAGLVLPSSVHAAGIVWDNVQNISGPGNTTVSTSKTQGGPGNNVTITNGTKDVSTLGTQVFGLNYSGTAGSTYPYTTTIDGQNFYSIRDSNPFSVSYSATGVTNTYPSFSTPGAAGQSYGNFDTAGVGPTTDYTLANAAYSNSTTGTITFGNLAFGRKYLLQLWVSDPRGGTVLPTRVEKLASSTGGDINSPTLAYEGPGSIDGQWVIGTFVADAFGTETVMLTGSNTNAFAGDAGSAQVNLLQLRDITIVPEPASLGLTGLGALGLLARRRRA